MSQSGKGVQIRSDFDWVEHNVLLVEEYNSSVVRSDIWSLFSKQLHSIITSERLHNFFLK